MRRASRVLGAFDSASPERMPAFVEKVESKSTGTTLLGAAASRCNIIYNCDKPAMTAMTAMQMGGGARRWRAPVLQCRPHPQPARLHA